MARIRSIKPEFFYDEKLATLDPTIRLFFIGLWLQADRRGRIEDRPMVLKAHIYPYDNFDADDALRILSLPENRFVIRYEVDGRKLLQITNFAKHQRPHKTERESLLPEMDKTDNGYLTVNQPLLQGWEVGGRGLGVEELKNIKTCSTDGQIRPSGPQAASSGENPNPALSFEAFWTLYPRRVGKSASRRAWKKLELAQVPFEPVFAGLNKQVSAWVAAGTEMKFIPHPSTWLNGERWNDEVDPPKKGWTPLEILKRKFGKATPIDGND